MANAEIFSHMPQVSAEILDRRLRLDPEYNGKRICVIGCLDTDGYGYLWSTADTPTLTTPASRLVFNELTQVTDLAQFVRNYPVNPNTGDTDELTPAIAEAQQQGATNIAVIRLDYAIIKSGTDNVLRGVQQTTGRPPQEWLEAMGLVFSSDGLTATNPIVALDPATQYVPSVAFREWISDLLSLSSTIETDTPQAHEDPSFADLRYYALGQAYNNLVGELVDVIVPAVAPGFINPARAQSALGIYPLRPETVISGLESSIIETAAPTINNPNLNPIILDVDPTSVRYLKFKAFDAVGFDSSVSITLAVGNGLTTGDGVSVSAGAYGSKAVVVASDPVAASGEFIVGGSATITAASLAAALTANGTGLTATASGLLVTITSTVAGLAGRLGVVEIEDAAAQMTISSSKASALLEVIDASTITQGIAYQGTVQVLSNTAVTTSDTVTIEVNSISQIFSVVASDPVANEFVAGVDEAATAENLRQAVLGNATLMAQIASAEVTTDTLTITSASVGNVGNSLATSDAAAFTVDDSTGVGTDGDRFIITSNSVNFAGEAGPLNNYTSGEFRADLTSDETTATNIAALINSYLDTSADANLRAFAVTDETLWYVAIFADMANSATVDYDLSVTVANIGSGLRLTDKEAGLAYASLTTLSGSDSYAATRNFAHQLGTFCFYQSLYETSCRGFIGCQPVDTNLDGILTNADLRDAIGQERKQISQYTDDAGGIAYSANGLGILGFVDMEGYDGIHRLHSSDDLPNNYLFFAHQLGQTLTELSRQENVVMLNSSYSDVLLVDSDSGQLMDMGARLRVTFGDVFSINAVSGKYDQSRGAYVTNAAVAIAGFYAIKPSGASLTQRSLRDIVPLRRIGNTQQDDLLKARFIPIQREIGINAGVITADDTGAFNIDEYHRSDFVMGLSLDVLDECVQDVRTITRPMLGRGMNARLIEHLTTEIDEALSARKKAGHIQEYNFNFLSTPVMQVLGEAQFELEVVPAFELRTLKIRAGLSMPSSSLVGAAASA